MKKALIFLFLILTCILFSQEAVFNIYDKANDDGSALIVTWDASMTSASKILVERKNTGNNLRGDLFLFQQEAYRGIRSIC